MKKTIGWIGTGVMGAPMCAHILRNGYEVSVYNRTPDKTRELVKAGAALCSSPEEVTCRSDIVFTIVGYPSDVAEVVFGQNGVLSATREGTILIDMTTSEPSLARRIFDAMREKGASSLDAPVSGGDVGAREATLAIMAGGERAVFDEALPLLRILGKNVAFMGEAGAGQHTKMSNQILIASTMIGVVESLLYAQKSGLDLHAVIDVIGSGAASSWSINNLGRRIVQGNFDPGFFIKHFVKDMGIALQEARQMKLSLPGLALAHQFYVSAMALGHEDLGTHGLYKVLATMNGI